MGRTAIAISAGLAALGAATASSWAATPLSVRDSWRIGNAGTSFCSAQSLTVDKALTGMFDSGYAITCRDAALSVGKLYKLRDSKGASARIASDRDDRATACGAPHRGNLAGVGPVDIIDCTLKGAEVGYRAYQTKRGTMTYASQGLKVQ